MIKGFKQYTEQAVKPVVFTFGRFNPPTTGHLKLLDKVAAVAKGNDYRIYASQSTDKKKNPLQYKEKVQFMRKMFPKHGRNIVINTKVKTALDIASELYDEGYNKLIMVVGGDRVASFQKLLDQYNDVKSRHGYYNFIEGIQVVSAGERDPDAEGVTGMSASKMRAAAMAGDFKSFQLGLPKGYSDGVTLFNTLRKRMGLREISDFREHVQLDKISDLREAYARGEVFNEGDIVFGKLNEEIRIKERKPNFIVDSKGNKHWITDLSEKKKPIKRAYKAGLSKSTAAKRQAQFRKQAKMSDDDPRAYKPAPGDARAKTKLSKHTKKYRDMFGEDEKRTPRKKGQHTGSSSHSDLYTDEDPKGTIKGLGFKDAATAKKGIAIINKSDRTHAHKVQATLVMQQRAKVAIGRTKDPEKKADIKAAYKIWTAHLEKLKKITKQKNEATDLDPVTEALITFAGKTYPRSGHIVILAGGAGSGKGFVLDNLVGLEGKVFDVDRLKSLAMRTPKIIKKVKDEFGTDISDLNLKNPDDVSKLHELIGDELNLPDRRQAAFFANILAQEPNSKPNVVFDVTLKDLRKLEKITRIADTMGYDKKNIHIVWVINDIEVAKVQNVDPDRGRVVPVEILVNTHRGASHTMLDIINMGQSLKKYMDGDIVFAFNKINVDSDLQKSKRGGAFIKASNYFYAKRSGKPVTPHKKLSNEIVAKIAGYVPTSNSWVLGSHKGRNETVKSFRQFTEKMECPPATQSVDLNTKNRNSTIEKHMYGPLNVDEPGDYWEKIADKWDTTVEAAKKSLCANCVAFDISPRMKDCMPGKISDGDGHLGYCWMHHFKCHSARTCDTWAKGGPIVDDTISHDWQERAFGQNESIDYPSDELTRQYKKDTPGEEIDEGPGKYKGETWKQGYERRVVKTTKPEHKAKGYNWRIKGKERNEISIKLYKKKPSYKEFTKQMKRVAGHEFGG